MGDAVSHSLNGIHKIFETSEKHLPRYISEFVARYNIRPKDTIEQMKGIVEGMENKRLRYRERVKSHHCF